MSLPTRLPPHAATSQGPAAWAASWWRMLHVGALLFAIALSPSTYSPLNRHAIAQQICISARQMIPWFTLLSALLSLVIVHIVVVTAQSYGLSQFALGTVIRVLVVELLPLSAALYVALRAGMGSSAEFEAMQHFSTLRARPTKDGDPLRSTVLPHVISSTIAVFTLVAISGGMALFLSYVGVYGITPWGLSNFSRVIGQVFDPVVIMSLGLKTLLYAAAVATIPATVSMEDPRDGHGASVATLQGTVRLFVVLIIIEILSLTAEFL
ncbi:MAG: ABC transporter permease [Zoogloeaceae bacterium]|nr:ABC transporter permease [Zoogloeaceae bacterium]